jgi:hypothetical protein
MIQIKEEDITGLIEGIDKNRDFITSLMEQIHNDMDHQLLSGIGHKPGTERDKSLFLLLVQNYVAGFLTAECDPPDDFTNAVRWFYAKGIEHGWAYLEVRKQNSQ